MNKLKQTPIDDPSILKQLEQLRKLERRTRTLKVNNQIDDIYKNIISYYLPSIKATTKKYAPYLNMDESDMYAESLLCLFKVVHSFNSLKMTKSFAHFFSTVLARHFKTYICNTKI